MGVVGIICFILEMVVNGGVGIEFDLDKVLVWEIGMVLYEYLFLEF